MTLVDKLQKPLSPHLDGGGFVVYAIDMRPKRCTMCSNRARPDCFTCSYECAQARNWRQHTLNRHRDRSKVQGTYTVTVEDWMSIVRRFNNCCAYCKRPNPKLTIDHIVPLSRGGRHAIANIVPACDRCNQKKGNLTLAEWRHYSKGKAKDRMLKLSIQYRKPWVVHEDLGIRPRHKQYSAKQNPIFDQVMQEQHDRIIMERINITVDYFGILR